MVFNGPFLAILLLGLCKVIVAGQEVHDRACTTAEEDVTSLMQVRQSVQYRSGDVSGLLQVLERAANERFAANGGVALADGVEIDQDLDGILSNGDDPEQAQEKIKENPILEPKQPLVLNEESHVVEQAAASALSLLLMEKAEKPLPEPKVPIVLHDQPDAYDVEKNKGQEPLLASKPPILLNEQSKGDESRKETKAEKPMIIVHLTKQDYAETQAHLTEQSNAETQAQAQKKTKREKPLLEPKQSNFFSEDSIQVKTFQKEEPLESKSGIKPPPAPKEAPKKKPDMIMQGIKAAENMAKTMAKKFMPTTPDLSKIFTTPAPLDFTSTTNFNVVEQVLVPVAIAAAAASTANRAQQYAQQQTQIHKQDVERATLQKEMLKQQDVLYKHRELQVARQRREAGVAQEQADVPRMEPPRAAGGSEPEPKPEPSLPKGPVAVGVAAGPGGIKGQISGPGVKVGAQVGDKNGKPSGVAGAQVTPPFLSPGSSGGGDAGGALGAMAKFVPNLKNMIPASVTNGWDQLVTAAGVAAKAAATAAGGAAGAAEGSAQGTANAAVANNPVIKAAEEAQAAVQANPVAQAMNPMVQNEKFVAGQAEIQEDEANLKQAQETLQKEREQEVQEETHQAKQQITTPDVAPASTLASHQSTGNLPAAATPAIISPAQSATPAVLRIAPPAATPAITDPRIATPAALPALPTISGQPATPAAPPAVTDPGAWLDKMLGTSSAQKTAPISKWVTGGTFGAPNAAPTALDAAFAAAAAGRPLPATALTQELVTTASSDKAAVAQAIAEKAADKAAASEAAAAIVAAEKAAAEVLAAENHKAAAADEEASASARSNGDVLNWLSHLPATKPLQSLSGMTSPHGNEDAPMAWLDRLLKK